MATLVEIPHTVTVKLGSYLAPVTGARVQVNVAGGGAASVKDAAGNPAANPVVTVNGRVEGYVYDDQDYDLAVSGTALQTGLPGGIAAYTEHWTILQDGAVVGPAASTNNGFVQFSGTTGKLIQDPALTLDTDTALAANSDARVPSQKAVKGYADGLPDVQVFNIGTSTWTKPPRGRVVDVLIIGPGAGGGSGRRGAAGTARAGGGGGGGGAISLRRYRASLLDATETVVVGAGGAGGAAMTGNDLTGIAGTSPTAMYFKSTAFSGVLGGAGGAGGTVAGIAGGTGGGGDSPSAGAGGSSSVAVGGGAGADVTGLVLRPGAGGGAGGSLSAANVVLAAGVGGAANGALGLILAGGAVGAAGAAGAPGAGAPNDQGGTGGGGGGAGNPAGGAGGAGGFPGGGGGGGGASLNGSPSGAGGPGGAGLVVVITW